MGLVPEFQDKVIAGLKRYGLNHGQSRGNNVRLSIYDEFEQFFSESAGAESALVMSSGYLAGTASLQLLSADADQIWVAPDTHPAILPTHLKPNPHQSFELWKRDCLKQASELPSQKILILGNAVDPLHSQVHDYTWLNQVGSKHELSLLVDDSHAFGVLGNDLFGTYAQLKAIPANLVVSGSIGKGLGLPAGIILCSNEIKAQLIQLPIYGGASPCPPGYLQAFLDCQGIYRNQKEKLSTNMAHFFKQISLVKEISGHPTFPVFTYQPDSWVEKLEQKGFITSSFPYPTTKDPRLNRIVISGFHLKEDLNLLSSLLIKLSKANS